ncbi:CPBP family intramembrane glutamic endopeptidase [Stenotrophomonas rhizophila]|uniref:CPBP family intramembrane glutamic endopeptidase n=1 Tax=Stenotrophomonas rhizophila TaxID=216778 RepID=UPI00112F2B64|nr:CPBP family intramembrane glutamic endopeptidase [Stenotrophomonas rhizophila]
MKRPSATPENFLIAAAVCWVAVGFVEMALRDSGVGPYKLLTELTAFALLVALFPREDRSRWTLARCLSGVMLAAAGFGAWLVFHANPSVSYSTFSDRRDANSVILIITLLTNVVAAPLFEEKLLRGLALPGIRGTLPARVAKFISPNIVGALIVSVVFGLAHPQIMLLAVSMSLALCIMATNFGFSTLQRACIHGLYNAAVTMWYVTYGFGAWD